MITGVGVVIPARDEQDHIEHCLDALAAALARLPVATAHAVCLVLDRCQDRTPERASRALARHPDLVVDVLTNHRPRTIGGLRHLGLRRALRRLADRPAHHLWLLSTDADSRVGPDWALDHLRHADRGAHAVAGTTELDHPASLGPRRLARYHRLVAAGTHGASHTHVYAANLGVRADAYLAVGGFPPVSTGEDHHLVRRLRAAGRPVIAATDIPVHTSARLGGRAVGGLADLLRDLTGETESELDAV